ncbi:MAG: right-handed parallel beta-helix repeat-containing protein [Candidatus Odinarchaeota archaeon]
MKTSQTIILVTVILTGLLVTGGGKQQAIEQDSGKQLIINSPGKGEIDNSRPKTAVLEPHAPIYIDGNLNFAGNASFEGWDGYGNGTHPYIIENYNITTGAAGTSGIEIRNTDVHFIIRDCFIRAMGTDAHGIYLYNVENGTLAGNTASNNNGIGIFLSRSSNSTISGNTASNNDQTGIVLSHSSNSTISGNTASTNLWYGIVLADFSSNSTISGNTASNNGQIGIVLADFSSNSTISGNTASTNLWYGIALVSSSSNNTISGNTVSNNNDGLCLWDSSNNTLSGNTVRYNNANGILSRYSNNNTLTGNTVTSNHKHGIYLASSDYNAIYLNEFIGNNRGAVQGYSGTNTNVFTNGSHGNFWSDYTGIDTTGDGIGEMSYSIDGGAGAEDPHPLMVSSIGVLTWPEQLLALNDAITNVSDWTWQPLQTSALTMELWLNDVSQGNQSGPFSWSLTLIEGDNNITAVAFFDANGPVTWPRTFLVTLDTTSPVINLTVHGEGGVYQSGTEITVTVTDHLGMLYYYWDTGPYVTATGFTFPLPSPDGTHVLYLRAIDLAGNTRLISFSFVTDDTPPVAVITGLTGQQTVSNALTVQVTPSDANGIARVEFELDGSAVHTDRDSPYIWTWDTDTVADGSHFITIRVHDVAGNEYITGPYTVLVDNVTTTTTTGTAKFSGITGLDLIAAIAAGGAGRVVSRRVKRKKMN